MEENHFHLKRKANEDSEDEEVNYAEIAHAEQGADPTTIRERIDNALEVLANLKSRKDKTKSRTDIIQALSRYVASLRLLIFVPPNLQHSAVTCQSTTATFRSCQIFCWNCFRQLNVLSTWTQVIVPVPL